MRGLEGLGCTQGLNSQDLGWDGVGWEEIPVCPGKGFGEVQGKVLAAQPGWDPVGSGLWGGSIPWEGPSHGHRVSALGWSSRSRGCHLSGLNLIPKSPGKVGPGALPAALEGAGRGSGMDPAPTLLFPSGPCWSRPRTDGSCWILTRMRNQQNPAPTPRPKQNPRTSCRR